MWSSGKAAEMYAGESWLYKIDGFNKEDAAAADADEKDVDDGSEAYETESDEEVDDDWEYDYACDETAEQDESDVLYLLAGVDDER